MAKQATRTQFLRDCQKKSLTWATKRRLVWTSEEIDKLKEMREAGYTILKCSEKLERTFCATSTACQRFNL